MTAQPRENERAADTGSTLPISARDVSVRFSAASEPTLAGVNLDVGEGEFVGLVGPTGCGKTTLLHLLAGAVPHNTAAEVGGTLRLFGTDTRALSFRTITAHVGLVLQDPEAQLFNLFVRDEIVWGLENRGLSRAQMRLRLAETMELFDIEQLRDRVTYDLSGGEKQRVALAAVFALKPEIILLDNPTSQLTPWERRPSSQRSIASHRPGRRSSWSRTSSTSSSPASSGSSPWTAARSRSTAPRTISLPRARCARGWGCGRRRSRTWRTASRTAAWRCRASR